MRWHKKTLPQPFGGAAAKRDNFGEPRKRISYGKIYEVPNNIEYEAKMQIMHCDINSPCAIILKQKNIFVKGLIINFL